jgi:hypothetical protein
MPRELSACIKDDNTPVSVEVYAFLASALAEESPTGWN